MNTITNPVIRGVAPDPSICRVGTDFFLATSTFDLLPGVRIHHSTDLVDWRIVGAAVTRPAQYRRDGRAGPIDLFAPTLRHNGERFYVACTNFAAGQGNFIVSAADPAGPWSDAAWVDTEAFDPSLLFADGTCYYTRRVLAPRADGRLGPIVQAEIDPDSGKLLGPLRDLTPDYGGFASNDIEGPHLYKIGDWYYLYSAEGGSWKCHMQTCARSRSPWGPFEPCPSNPVLTHRNRTGHPIQTLGHSDLVEAADGSWWAVTHGTRHEANGGFVYHHNLGRETFLAPVTWRDGWPIVGDDGTLELSVVLDRPLPAGTSAIEAPQTVWTAGWSSIGPPAEGTGGDPATGRYRVPFSGGLTAGADAGAVGALLLPQREDTASFTAILDAAPAAPAAAGIAVYTDRAHHYSLLVTDDGGARRGVLRRQADDLVAETAVDLPGTGPVELRVDATPERYVFSADGRRVGAGSARLLSAEAAEAFAGCRFALVADGDPAAAEPAEFTVCVRQ